MSNHQGSGRQLTFISYPAILYTSLQQFHKSWKLWVGKNIKNKLLDIKHNLVQYVNIHNAQQVV